MNQRFHALFVAALAAGVPTSTQAQGPTCASQADCVVAGANCIDGVCRLSQPRPLISTLDVAPLALRFPANLARVADGSLDFEVVPPAGAQSLAIVVSRAWPQYDVSGQLLNPKDVVWYWRSDWEGIATGLVAHSKGRLFEYEEEQCKPRAPVPLAAGVYHWAALAWDSTGQVSHQSEVRSFSVGRETLTGRGCDDARQCESAGSATCYRTHNYCAIRCASDADCFAGTTCDLEARHTEGFAWGVCRPSGATCACGPDEYCDDAVPGGLRLCFRPLNDGQSSAGCDCPFGSSSSSDPPPLCFAGVVLTAFWRMNRHLRKTRRR